MPAPSDPRRKEEWKAKIAESWTRKSQVLIDRAVKAPKKSLGYVAGVVASDGCVVSKPKGPSRIEMKTVNRSFAELFYTRLLEVFGKASIYTKKNTSEWGSSSRVHPFVWQVELSGKLVPSFVEKLLVSETIFSSDKEFKVGLLQGLFDGDGYVKRRLKKSYRKKREGKTYNCTRREIDGVGFTSGWRELLQVVLRILGEFGIRAVFEDTRSDCARVMIYGAEGVRKFSEIIGFRVDYRKAALEHGLKEISA
jgi:hypothetical protein